MEKLQVHSVKGMFDSLGKVVGTFDGRNFLFNGTLIELSRDYFEKNFKTFSKNFSKIVSGVKCQFLDRQLLR